MSLIAIADDMKNTLALVLVFVMLNSCAGDNHTNPSDRVFKISKVHAICVNKGGLMAKSTENGPDFDYGVLSDGRGNEVEYYVSDQSSHYQKNLVSSSVSSRIMVSGIVVFEDVYSGGKRGFTLRGYRSAIDGSHKIFVQYYFSSGNADSEETALELAGTTRHCMG